MESLFQQPPPLHIPTVQPGLCFHTPFRWRCELLLPAFTQVSHLLPSTRNFGKSVCTANGNLSFPAPPFPPDYSSHWSWSFHVSRFNCDAVPIKTNTDQKFHKHNFPLSLLNSGRLQARSFHHNNYPNDTGSGILSPCFSKSPSPEAFGSGIDVG